MVQADFGLTDDYFVTNPLPMCVVDRLTTRFVAVNAAATRAYGFGADAFSTMSLLDVLPAEDAARFMQWWTCCEIDDPFPLARPPWRHVRGDGSPFYAHLVRSPLVARDDRELVLVTIFDVTEQARLHADLITRSAALAHAQELAGIGSFMIDPQAGTVYLSGSAAARHGTDRIPLSDVPAQFARVLAPEDVERIVAGFFGILETRQPIDTEYTVLVGGERRLVRTQSAFVNDRVIGTVLDVTEARRASEQLTRVAFFDSETGLLNWQGLLANADDDGEQQHPRSGFMLVRVRWNTAASRLSPGLHGEHMKVIAEILRSVLPASAQVARYSNDTFAVYIRLGPSGGIPLRPMAAAIHAAFEQPIALDEHTLAVSATAALAADVSSSVAPAELARRAEIAMRTADAAGANTACFSYKVETAFDRRVFLEQALRRAVEDDRLSIVYQPVVSLRNGRVIGAEALMRWDCPQIGEVSPNEFIAIAEDTGVVLQLDAWILQQACMQARAWQRERLPKVRVSVNVSRQQLGRRDFVDLADAALEAACLDAKHLQLDVNESVMVNPSSTELRNIEALRRRGASIALDDFGTGRSSVGYLRKLDADVLKLDHSLVAGIDEDRFLADTTRAVAMLAHRRGMRVLAEGVETAREAELLRAIGCDEAQGHFFGRPMSAERFREILMPASEERPTPAFA